MSSFKSIGGYFGLHTSASNPYYSDLLALNSGRNALEYILLSRNYKKIYLPFFTCDVLLEPFKKHAVEYEFYKIDFNLEPVQLPELKKNEAFLYTNYFGLKSNYINQLIDKLDNLILDYAQAFFCQPLKGVDTFYSPRKFFGIPDGAYVSTDAVYELPLNKDSSVDRFSHLLIRIEEGAEAGYEVFKKNDNSLIGAPIREMSNLTKSLLGDIDYNWAKERRNRNFNFLHQHLKEYNQFEWLNQLQIDGPLVYPFYSFDEGLRAYLIKYKIFVATYWPNVLVWTEEDSIEYQLTNNVVYLPIDHRYNEEDMRQIINTIYNYYGFSN